MNNNLHALTYKQTRLHIHRSSSRPIAALVLYALLLLASIVPVQAESKTLLWNRLDCDITVQSNGDLRVVETNVIDFTSGSFTFGYRDINQNRLTAVKNIQVTQDNNPLKFETSQTDSGDFRIKYYFSAAQNEIRTFKLAYTVIGATRYYTNGDVIYWAPVYAARNGFSVQDSKTTVRLPAGATALIATTFGPTATVTGRGESLVVAESREPIVSGKQLEVLVSIPHGIISGDAPAWQAAYDEEQQSKVASQANEFIPLLVGLLLIFGGPALLILLWFTRGRDPGVGMVAEYLNEPPAGITPGMAGTLVDGSADMQDMIATVIDLGRRGLLSLLEQGTTNPAGVVVARDYFVSRGPHFKSAQLATYESRIINAMRLNEDSTTTLSAVQSKLYSQVALIKRDMYDELIHLGIYSYNPETSRSRYSFIGVLILIFGCVVACATSWISSTYSVVELCPAVGIGLNAVILLFLASRMQARTRKGADTKMRVVAFKKYLQNIEKYTDIRTAKDLFDKYLPYAIAFGLDRSWIQKFTAVQAPAPAWYIPFDIDTGSIRSNRGFGNGNVLNAGAALAKSTIGDVSGAAIAPVTMDKLSEGLSSSLSDVDKGLTTMFTSVTASFLNKPLGVGNAVGAAANIASSVASTGNAEAAKAGVEIAGAILGAVVDIALGGGGSSGGGGGGFG